MSKRNIIIIAVIVILVGAALGYYFLYYTNNDSTDELTEDTVELTEEQTQNDSNTTEESVESDQTQKAQNENQEGSTEVANNEEQEEQNEEQDEFEVNLEEKYAYRKELRNPFGNIVQKEPEIKEEDLTIPFKLDGIISNGDQNIAVISTPEGPEFISNSENIGEYYISDIRDEQIKIRYKYLTVFMKIGGALVE